MTESATFRQCDEEKGEANNTQESLHSHSDDYYANSNIQMWSELILNNSFVLNETRIGFHSLDKALIIN